MSSILLKRIQFILRILRNYYPLVLLLLLCTGIIDPFGWFPPSATPFDPIGCHHYRFTLLDDVVIPAHAQGFYRVDRAYGVVFFKRNITNDTFIEIKLKPRFDVAGKPVDTLYVLPKHTSFSAESDNSGEFWLDSNPYFTSIISHSYFDYQDHRLTRKTTLNMLLGQGVFKIEELRTVPLHNRELGNF